MLLCSGVTCGIQFSGILVINNYGPTLYGILGYDAEQQLVLLGGWLTLAFGCGVISLLFVDHFPRPKLIGGGIAACMCTRCAIRGDNEHCSSASCCSYVSCSFVNVS